MAGVYEFSSDKETYSVVLSGVLRIVKSFLPRLLITPTAENQTVILDNKHSFGTRYYISNTSDEHTIQIMNSSGDTEIFSIPTRVSIIIIYVAPDLWEIVGGGSTGGGDTDGGFANSVYLSSQSTDGGDASGK
jgi:hypothetical protein